MIIIRKRRLTFVLTAIFVSVFTYIGLNSNQSKTVQTVGLPVSNKVIIIDAGHGLPDGGTVGNNGTIESEINLKIALKVQQYLEQSGSTVILTRSDENGISGLTDSTIRQKHVADLKNRVKIGNESSANIFVSIHLNKISQTEYSGWQAFYKSSDAYEAPSNLVTEDSQGVDLRNKKDNGESIKLASSIQKAIGDAVQKENKREPSKISGIYIVDNVEIPLTIVECGFLSNAEEERLLNTDEYQNKLAWGIYNGIMEYFYEK